MEEGYEDLKKDNIDARDTKLIENKEPKAEYLYISVDPLTGEKTDAATAQEDVANRRAFSKRSGIPVSEVSAPAPKSVRTE